MYVKLFTSIYQGTLRGNSNGLLVFTNLLAHADKEGKVDIHPKAIAEEVGLTIDQVRDTLLMLESPDNESRSPENEGRRIVRLDEHRSWGWLIVNYDKYRSIKNEEERREQNRIAQEKYRNKHKQIVSNSKHSSSSDNHQSAVSAHTEAEAEAEAEVINPILSKQQAVNSLCDCPHKDIISIYSELLSNLRQPRLWDGERAKVLAARWKSLSKPNGVTKGYSTKEDGLLFWKKFFEHIAENTTLPDGYKRTDGSCWQPDLPWLIKSENFKNIVEGKYDKHGNN